MKTKLNYFQKVVFILNLFFGLCLVVAYILPFIPPKFSAFLSILNLGLPVFMLINLIFAIYWVLRLKLQFLISAVLVVLGYPYINNILSFNDISKHNKAATFKVMSYNVRLFNEYEWLDEENVALKISNFVTEEAPDVVAFQDYLKDDQLVLNDYPYSFEKFKTETSKIGIAIFSKYRIINKGTIDFPDTYNNAIYTDIVVNNDTLRIYAAHLESLKIIPDVNVLQKENRQRLVSRVGKSFVKQQEQAKMLTDNFENCHLKKIVCIDMNNTSFSYVANRIQKHNLKDAFIASGRGLGKTFDFDFLPLRIDAIFNEKSIENVYFQNYDIKLSDHYPIMAGFEL